MTIYEIDRQIQALLDGGVDEDTGELTIDTAQLDELQMARERKVENLALYVKNTRAEALAIREEEKALAERRKALEAKTGRAEEYLQYVLDGDRFSSPRVAISWRTTRKAVVDAGFLAWATEHQRQLLRFKEPEPDKAEILRLLRSGESIPHTHLEESRSVTIK